VAESAPNSGRAQNIQRAEYFARARNLTRRKRLMKEPISPKYVKPRQAAAHLGVAYNTFRHAVDKGILPFYQLGTTRLFKLDELDAALKAHRVSTTSEVLS
jgi:excisionase family DNA binding protein